MSTRMFLSILLLAGTVFGASPMQSHAQTDKPTNVILIMADDIGAECLSTYGSASYKTPNLDKLAATGVKFTECHSQPLCTPSRVKIMTGRMNYQNYEQFGILNPREKTFGHLFRDNGYSTCVSGKWQLYGREGEWAGKGSMPDQLGFQRYALWHIWSRSSRYAEPEIFYQGEAPKIYKGAYGPDLFSKFVTDFIEEKKDKPFFAYYPMTLPHGPHVPTPNSDVWANGDRLVKDEKYFKDMVEYIDVIIGNIVETLEKNGLRENTLLIFTGDNGTSNSITTTMQDGSKIKGGKGHTDTRGTLVPLIVSWPGMAKAGSVCNDLIGFTDMMPTIAEAAGIEIPESYKADGVSFLPQIKGETGTPRDWLMCYYYPQRKSDKKFRFSYDKRWKLYDDGRYYDMKNDIEETNVIPVGEAGKEGEERRKVLQGVLDKAVKGAAPLGI